MYAVVHGGTDVDLRRQSAAYLGSLPFDGFAIGGALSAADIVLYSKFADCCTTRGLFGPPNSEPFGSKTKTDDALAKYAPKLGSILSQLHRKPEMQAYLEARAAAPTAAF